MGGSGESGTAGVKRLERVRAGLSPGSSAPATMPRTEAFMKNLARVLAMALLPGLAIAADNPDWAYPGTPKPAPLDNVVQKQMPGSAKKYTQAQIDDGFNPPDWFPDEHPPMPEIVAIGRKPARACALCHLPTGDGHPESSSLAGLPAAYLVRQMAAFKNGERKGVRANAMIDIAKAISDADVRAAGEYFAALKQGVWTKVVEAGTVPKSVVGSGANHALRHGAGLDHLRPDARLEGREILARGAHVGVRDRFRDIDHRVRPDALSFSVLERGHLAHEIRGGEAREARGFGVAVPRRKMAQGAGARRLSPDGDDFRHRRMLVGKPVGRIEAVVDLRLRVLLRAPGHLLLHHIVEGRGLGRGRIGPLGILRPDRKTGEQDDAQNADKISHG